MKDNDDNVTPARVPEWHDNPLVPPVMWAGYLLVAVFCLLTFFISGAWSVTTYMTDFFYVLTHYWGRL